MVENWKSRLMDISMTFLLEYVYVVKNIVKSEGHNCALAYGVLKGT